MNLMKADLLNVLNIKIVQLIIILWNIRRILCLIIDLCCNRQINSGIAVLFVSNHKYMPNFFAHAECLKEYENNTDKLFSDIESKWQKYKKLKKYFEE